MPERKDEAAAVGRPGRTEIVGKRRTKPAMKPRRVYSFTSVSQMIFSAPYEDCGVGVTLSSTTSGNGCP